jgi:hypothetical protein
MGRRTLVTTNRERPINTLFNVETIRTLLSRLMVTFLVFNGKANINTRQQRKHKRLNYGYDKAESHNW